MIRVCTINDKEKYLQEEPYAGAILAAIEEFGFDEKFQTVYLDSEKRNLDTEGEQETEETVKGVYLWFHKNLLLYSKENKVDIDFLEQMIFMAAPDCVVGRKDNVNIVSWLLTDYHFKQSPKSWTQKEKRLRVLRQKKRMQASGGILRNEKTFRSDFYRWSGRHGTGTFCYADHRNDHSADRVVYGRRHRRSYL